MKNVYIVNIVWISLIIVFVIFYKIMSGEFAKIENEVVDKYDEKVIVTYTTKNDIEKLYINNQKFLSELVHELNEIEDIYKYSQISIPFTYPEEDVMFYGNKDNKVEVSESLKEKFILLSRGLKINQIFIRIISAGEEHLSNGNLNCTFIFSQWDCMNNSYIGLMASPINLELKEDSFIDVAFDFDKSKTVVRNLKLDTYEGIYWYYRLSRDTDSRLYPFRNRIYDIVKGNLN